MIKFKKGNQEKGKKPPKGKPSQPRVLPKPSEKTAKPKKFGR